MCAGKGYTLKKERRKEKGPKMKMKLVTTLMFLMLLIGTVGVAFNFASPAKAVDTYVWLTIDYAPAGMPVPDTAPSVGVHNYTIDSVINITAPLEVDDGDTKYLFDNWTITFDSTVWSTTNNKHMITMSQNKTATAYYKVQYLFTVITAFDVPNIWDGSWYENVSSRWFDAGATTYAGVMKNNPNDWISTGTWERAYFINWTGDSSGKTYYPGYFWTSDPITMDGPKTAVAEWVMKYYLWTDPDSEYDPWGPGSNEFDPDKRGWYDDCTDVDLTAPSVDNENVGNWRWRFDYWIVERWNGSAWVTETLMSESITVHLGPQTKATGYFFLQYYLTVADSPSMLDTGLEGYSGYYDYCTDKTLVAPDPVPDPSDPGIRWVFDHWYLAGVLDVYNTTVTVHIEDANCVGKTLYAIYTREYFLEVTDNIGGLSGVSSLSGWFAPGTVVPLTAPDPVSGGSDTQYVFIEWVKDPGNFKGPASTAITMNGPRTATAYYKTQYWVTWTANPSSLNTQLPGWPGGGWRDANVKYWWSADSGPLSGYPFDFYFDHWEMNGVPQAQYASSVLINTTGPITGVAVYLGKPAFFITPQMVVKDAPAECTTFTVNVTAANLIDLYAMDFKVTWDPVLLELVDVDVEVDEIWTEKFVAKNEVNNTAGTYWFVATSLDDYGFNGTNKIVALTFHIIYDPCYIAVDYYVECDLDLDINQLANHNAQPISPWNIHGGEYRINALQPKIEMRPDLVTASQKDVVFTVEIWIVDAVKLHDWYAEISFNTDHLDIIEVEIDTTFLTGPYEIFQYEKHDDTGEILIYIKQQQPGETLAYGEGRLATLTFKVHDTIFWTTPTNPILHSWIIFTDLWISVKCPDLYWIPMGLLDIVECEYKYIPIPGDVNMDGVVNVLDLQLVAADYGSSTTYDLNEDLDVDLIDLVLVAINFGRNEP